MLRVTGGRLRGRKLESPSGSKTHPMGDRVKAALFNALGNIEGLTVLDAFAGSGALSFEALSRGARHATAIDNDKRAQKTIQENIKSLKLEKQIKLIRANCSSWSDNNPDTTYDLVIAAPPYDNLQLSAVKKLVRHVEPGGLYVLDWPGKQDLPKLPELDLVKELNFGDAKLGFYRKAK